MKNWELPVLMQQKEANQWKSAVFEIFIVCFKLFFDHDNRMFIPQYFYGSWVEIWSIW